MSEATRKAADPMEHAHTLKCLTEEAERITEPLEWPEAILCGGPSGENLRPDGATFVLAMIPLIRERAEAAYRLALGGQNHPADDYGVATEIADDLLSGLLALWSLESPEGRPDAEWPPEAVAVSSARLSIRKAADTAREYHDRRTKEAANV